jgi:hypothetical protein
VADQGRFALGYYHQRAMRKKSSETTVIDTNKEINS